MSDNERDPRRVFKGRGAVSEHAGRFQQFQREGVDDGWGSAEAVPESPETVLAVDKARRIITYNRSPDIPFDRSINPYRGCEHGCIYCYARPTHTYLDLSPGLDFETRLFYKPDAVERLLEELAAKGYQCAPVALGVNTDAYQPVERRLRLTRGILEVLRDCRHPVTLVTKSALIERDVDILAPMAAQGLAHVAVSVTTLDGDINRTLEPRAAGPRRRLRIISTLAAAGVPVSVNVAPVIPVITDHELEAILEAAAEAGAFRAAYIMLRLPHEVRPLFQDWLQAHHPGKAEHVYSIMRSLHQGREYDSGFGQRMRGQGQFADLVAQRFRVATRRLGLDRPWPELDCGLFERPQRSGDQLTLF